jgi:hypothetical protein
MCGSTAGDGERAEQVDGQHLLDLLVRQLFQGAEQPVPRVVDQDVDRAACQGALDRGPYLAGVGDVQRERERGVRVLLDEIAEGVRIAGRRDDRLAAGEEGLGQHPAEPGGGTRDEPAHAAIVGPPPLIRPRHVRSRTHRRAR